LATLLIDGNKELKALPSTIGSLTNLTRLHVGGNALQGNAL
jgi:hypothetical protein